MNSTEFAHNEQSRNATVKEIQECKNGHLAILLEDSSLIYLPKRAKGEIQVGDKIEIYFVKRGTIRITQVIKGRKVLKDRGEKP